MTQGISKLKIYTVVEVWRGIAVGARTFRRLRNAEKYLERARQRYNLEDDDVQLFVNYLGTAA
jgi:hypothetical protein